MIHLNWSTIKLKDRPRAAAMLLMSLVRTRIWCLKMAWAQLQLCGLCTPESLRREGSTAKRQLFFIPSYGMRAPLRTEWCQKRQVRLAIRGVFLLMYLWVKGPIPNN